MVIGNRFFDTARETYLMGILNYTPDSFSDGGNYNDPDAALRRAEEMIREGAAVIDVGGESARQGYVKISEDEEIMRTAPLIEAIKARFDIPVSVDTYKSAVARAALAAGADLVNDIWGLKADPKMAETIAQSGAACCLMHNRRQPGRGDLMEEMILDLKESLALAKRAGISDDKIILDPGIGFGKTYENNLTAIKKLDRLHELGYPLLLGASRKSVIGLTLDLPVTERVEGTLVTSVFGVQQGCAFLRVHDVRENMRAVRMAKAILSEGIMLI